MNNPRPPYRLLVVLFVAVFAVFAGCEEDEPGDGNEAVGDANASLADVHDTSVDPPFCGDGQLDDEEECDDGNAVGRDGCSEVCDTEAGWTCYEPGEACARTCGNGVIDAGERCDDGNESSGDGCGRNCSRLEYG